MKPGYKQTDVGVIPDEWEIQPLSRTIERLEAGVSVNSVDENLTAYAHNQSVLKTSAVTEGRFLPHECKKIAPRDLDRVRLRPQADTIIISRMNTPDLVGECGFVEQDYENLFLPDRLWMTKQRSGSEASIRWLSYLLSSKPQKARIKELATGTSGSMKNLAKGSLLELQIPTPPPPEQRAIAEALSDVDGLLGGLDRLIAKKRDLKQAAMQQLLTGQTRLPGFHGEWEVKRLGDVADPNRRWSFIGGPFGSNLKSSDYTDDGVRIIQLQNIGDGQFKDDYEIYTSQAKADELLGCNIYPGEIILSKMGDPVARACIIPPRHKRYLMCSDGIRLAVDPRRFDTYFVYTQINAPDFRDRAANAGTGSTRKRIGLTELRGLELTFPPLPEQTAIASVLREMDAELAGLEQRREKTRALKQAMMQELLTGRIRLV